MAPAHLQGALFNICMAPAHLQGALTSPCARQFFIPTRGSVCPPTSKGGNFLTKWRFQRNVAFSHLASRDARRRAPRVPFGTTQEEFSFDIQQQVLLPALPIFHNLVILLVRGEDLDGSRSAGWARSGRSCRPMGLVASSAPREAAERRPGG